MPKTRILIKKRQQTVQYYTEKLVEGVGLDMALIPAGQFWMGSPETELDRNEDRESPQHWVSVPEFFMGRYPVTQGQWKAVVENTDQVGKKLNPEPSKFKEDYEQEGDRWLRPVERVNWYDAIEFCARLEQLTGRKYRLPSEAEWEYACRGVSVDSEELTLEEWNKRFCQPFHFGETISTDLANYDGTDDPDGKWKGSYGRGVTGEHRKQTTPVGYFKVANAFGLYDMHGNVWEWCADPWHENYNNAPDDGTVWDEESIHQYYSILENANSLLKSQQQRVYRGGSWYDYPRFCRSACRYRRNADFAYYDLGFRVCRSRPSIS